VGGREKEREMKLKKFEKVKISLKRTVRVLWFSHSMVKGR
jgi:hypothetical protein